MATAATSRSESRRPYAARMPPEERREQLLDATLEVIAERGFGAVTIDAVARGAGVARPVVYRLFDDRAGLLAALFGREQERALSQIAAAIPAIPDERDPDELLVAGLRVFLEAVAESPTTWKLVLVDIDSAPEELRTEVLRRRAIVREQIQQLVAWGVERRGGPEGLDAELFARMVQTFAEEAARLVISDPKRFPTERFLAMVELLLASIERGHPDPDLPPPPLDLQASD
jgi:AcrR family transcriptional regulator